MELPTLDETLPPTDGFWFLSLAHTWPLSSFWWCIDHIELSYDYTSELDQWSLQPFIKSIRQLLKWAEPPTWSQGSQSQRIKKTKEMSAKTFCQSKKLLRLESNLATFYPSFPCEKGQYFRQHPFQLFAFPSLPNFNHTMWGTGVAKKAAHVQLQCSNHHHHHHVAISFYLPCLPFQSSW